MINHKNVNTHNRYIKLRNIFIILPMKAGKVLIGPDISQESPYYIIRLLVSSFPQALI